MLERTSSNCLSMTFLRLDVLPVTYDPSTNTEHSMAVIRGETFQTPFFLGGGCLVRKEPQLSRIRLREYVNIMKCSARNMTVYRVVHATFNSLRIHVGPTDPERHSAQRHRQTDEVSCK